MKHLNDFLRHDVTQTQPSLSVHRRLTVGGTTLKHIAFVLLFLIGGIGNVWGTDVEVISTLNTTSNITLNATATNVNNVLSITGTKGTNNFPVFNYNATKGVDLRFYSGSTCAVTFTVASGYKLDGIIFKKNTTTASSISNLTANNGTLSNNSWTAGEKTQSVKFTYNSTSNFKEQIYLIYLTYSVDGGSEEPTCSEGPLDAPEVTAVAGDKTVTLSWETDANATGYQLKWNGGNWADASSPVEKSNLTNGTAYTYQVKAIGDGTNYCDSDPTTEASATPNLYHTVTWNTHNGQFTTTSVLDDTKPTFPKVNDANPTSCDNNCNIFYGWATSSFFKTDDVSGKTIYTSASDMPKVTTDDVEYYAVFTDAVATDYSTTYTSNVTLSTTGGTKATASTASINSANYDAIKLGSSGNAGNFNISVPSGTTKLYLHALAWSDNNNNTLTLSATANGVTINPATAQTLTANSGVSGSGPTYTLSNITGDFFEYTLSGVNAATTITISCSERCLVWGVNATDGSVSEDAHFLTNCCTPLGSIIGSVSVSQTSATLTWDVVADAEKYEYQIQPKGTDSDPDSWVEATSGVVVSDLTCGTEYTAYFRAIDTNNSHCSVGPESSKDFKTSSYSITLLNEGSVLDGEATIGMFEADKTTACSKVGTPDVVTLTATAETGYHFENWDVYKTGDATTKVTVNENAGVYTFTMPAYDVTVSTTFVANSTPTLPIVDNDVNTINSVTFANQEIGVQSAAQSIFLMGENLTADVTWTLSGDDAAYFAVSPASPIAQADAASQELEIKFTPNAAREFNAMLTFSSTGANDKVITLSGNGVNLYTVSLNLGGGEGLASTTGWTNDNGVWKQKQASFEAPITLPNATLSSGLSTAGWSFAGWKTEAVSSKTGDAQTFENTLYTPTSDITLYAVYQTSVGGIADYELVESDLGTAWAGDYLIAYSNTVFADGRVGGTDGLGKQNQAIDPTTAGKLSGKKVDGVWGDTYNVTLEEISENSNTYVLKTKDGKYNYQTSNANGLSATETKATAAIYPISVTFTSSSDIKLALGGNANGAVFRYNTGGYFRFYKDGGQSAVYLYKKGAAAATYYSNPSSTVTLTYVGNGQTSEVSTVPAVAEYSVGAMATVVAQPNGFVKTGYTFAGWNTKEDGTGLNYVNGSEQQSFTINADMTLYAKWTINKHTVAVLDVANGTITATPADASEIAEGSSNTEVAYGTVVTLAQTNDTHYTFGTWTVMAGETPLEVENNQFTMPDADVTISANFTEDAKRTVKFYSNGAQVGTDQEVYVGETSSAPSAVAPECFGESDKFVGWATTPWTGTVDNPTLLTAIPAVEAGEGAISYHAVFAKRTTSETSSLSQTLQYDTWTYSGSTTDKSSNSYRLFHSGSYIESAAFDLSRLDKVVVKGGTFGGDTYNSLTIGDGTNVWKNVTVSGSSATGNNEYTDGTALSGTKALRIISNSGSTSGNGSGIRISKVEIYTRSVTYSKYMTTCQSDLGAIDGTVALAQVTEEGENKGKLRATWTMASKDGLADDGIIIKIYKEGTAEAVHTSSALSKDETSYVATDLTPNYCSEYYATLTPIRANETYKEGVEQGKSANNCVVGGEYTYHVTLDGMKLKDGESEAADNCTDFSAIYETTGTNVLNLTGVVVTNVQDGGYTWNAETGALTIDKTKVTGNVEITLTGNVPSNPIVTVDPSSWDFGSPILDGLVDAKDFVITGSNLTNAISVAMPNDAFAYTFKSGSFTPDANGEVAATITVTPSTSSLGDKGGNIVVSGEDLAANVNVAISLNVQQEYTVNWYVNGSIVKTQTGVAGTDYEALPDGALNIYDCSDLEFMGWKDGSAINGYVTEAPSLANVGTTIPEADKNYYAVFAEGTPGGKAEHTFDLSTSNTDWVPTNCEDYFSKPYGMKTANAKVVNDSIADFASYANTAEGISIKVNCFQNGGTTSRMTVSLVDADGNAIAGTGKEFTPTNASAVNGAEDSEVTYSASEVKNKNAKGYMIQLTTKDKNVLVLGTSYEITKANVYSKWYTTCPHITNVALSAGSAEHGSISFAKGGEAVTSVRTDGGSAVEVDVVANIDEGYELTGLTLTSEDVTGATKNDELTKITIPAGQEGTLTVTPTITLIPKYSITFAKGDDNVIGTDPDAMEDQYAGTPITLPENNYTWTDHKYDGWKVTYVDANQQVQEVAVSDNTFTMPAANVTITAQWIEYVTCAVNAYVNGTLVQTEEVQSEQALALSAFGTPSAPEGVTGYTFAGWALNEESSDVASIEMLGTSITPEAGVASINIYAVFSRIGDDVTDVLTAADLAATGNSYVAFSDVQKLSAAKYAGASTKSGENIQIHSNGNPYKGIVSTVSGGLLKSISVTWGNGSNTLDVYASNTAYTEMGNLFTSGKQGTKVTSFTATGSYDFTTDYSYIGIRSNNNAIYLSRVEITWKSIYYTTRPGAVYAVSYDLGNDGNGHDGAWEEGVSHETINVKGGSTFEITSDVPVLEHFNFSGWKVGNTTVSGTITINGPTSIVAQWTAKVKNGLTYSDGAAENPVTIVDQNIEEGTQIMLPSAADKGMSKTDYTFKGWKYNNKLYKAGDTFIMPATDATLVANWKKDNISTESMALITDVSMLTDGMQVVLAYAEGRALAGDGTTYLASVTSDVTFANDNDTVSFGSGVLTLTIEKAGEGWKLRKDASNYLNETKVKELAWVVSAENATTWIISIIDNNAVIANSATPSNVIRYNTQSPRFLTYASGQAAIQLYGKVTMVKGTQSVADLGHMDEDEVIVVPSGAILEIDEPTAAPVVARPNAKVVVKNDAETALIVEDGGEVDLQDNASTPVFRLATAFGSDEEGDESSSGQLRSSVANTVLHVAEMYMDVQLISQAGLAYMSGKSQTYSNYWYSISAPFDVNIADGFYTTNGTPMVNNVHFQIWEFAPDQYANGGRGWRRCTTTMQARRAYLIGFDLAAFGDEEANVPKVVRLKMVNVDLGIPVPSVEMPHYDARYAWNGIGNPNVYQVKTGRGDQQFYNNKTHNFGPYDANDPFVVGQPIFCKASSANESLTVTDINESLSSAPNRTAGNSYSFKVRILKQGARFYDNQMFIRASEDALATFEEGKDMETLNDACNGSALIWTNAYGKRLAIEDAPLTNNQAMYDLTIMTPAAGTYVLRQANEVQGADLYVTYEGQIVWNLSLGDYEMDLTRGTTTGYGLLLVVQPNQMPTGVENGELLNGENGVQKILLNGNLYILRDGHVYDAVGKQAR